MGLRPQSLSQAQAGERGWERQRRPALEEEGGRKGRKVDVVKLDLEQLQGDWERQGADCGWTDGGKKEESLNRD